MVEGLTVHACDLIRLLNITHSTKHCTIKREGEKKICV